LKSTVERLRHQLKQDEGENRRRFSENRRLVAEIRALQEEITTKEETRRSI